MRGQRPPTGTGVVCCVTVPSPSWPLVFRPHALTPAATARLCDAPTAMAVAPVRPVTVTGDVAFAVEPLPSWPLRPLPQQRALPLDRTAQAWVPPTATWLAEEIALTPTGVDEVVVVALPS